LNHIVFWILFNLFVVAMLVLDLGVLNRVPHALKVREAVRWTCVWVGLAACFAILLYFWQGRTTTLEFTTGYLLELSLSVDNLFVFLLVFRYFKVPPEYQHKVLFWGIIGALVMRGIFILVGIGLMRRFAWMSYVFGVLIVYSAIRILKQGSESVDPGKNPVLRLLRRALPVTESFEEDRFFVRRDGLYATPLLVVLVFVEITDLLFATDSIPAVMAITLNAFVVFTSNVFAVLGLRSMFFALAGTMELFHYLDYGLAVVLMFIGAKMLLAHYYTIPTLVALAVIGVVLTTAVVASLLFPAKKSS
jgi:tellurite resistance protein TerC